jgi:hypothetical protein
MSHRTHFEIIISDRKHLGSKPSPRTGVTYVGNLYHVIFRLPENLDQNEPALIQCKTLHNQVGNKRLFINTRWLKNFLEPHPENRKAWIIETSVVPKGWLEPGENSILIGYSDKEYDDYVLSDMVLWYKTREPR